MTTPLQTWCSSSVLFDLALKKKKKQLVLLRKSLKHIHFVPNMLFNLVYLQRRHHASEHRHTHEKAAISYIPQALHENVRLKMNFWENLKFNAFQFLICLVSRLGYFQWFTAPCRSVLYICKPFNDIKHLQLVCIYFYRQV